MLDRVATDLQAQGLVDQAKELDIVSNTLDAAAKEAYTTMADPSVTTMTREYREVVYDYILDALETLYKSELGNNGVVNGLLRFWMGQKNNLVETAKDPMSFYQEQPVSAFSRWLAGKTSTDGAVIPDKYFREGKNTRGSTWEDLGHFMAILTTSGPQKKNKNRMDLKDFMNQEQISESTPKKYSPELEALFKKEAAFHEVDAPFKNSIALIYALKPKGVPQGNFKQPNLERRSEA